MRLKNLNVSRGFGASTVIFCAALLFVSPFFVAGCAGTQATGPAGVIKISGTVHGGQQPVTGSTIQLYAAGSAGDGSAATALIAAGVTTSDGSGNAANSNANAGNSFNSLPAGSFNITGDYTCPSGSTEVYLTSTGGNPGLAAGTNNQAIALMAALGPCSGLSSSTFVAVNELTTIGSIVPLHNFITSYSAIGSGSADASTLQSAFGLVNEYVNTASGSVPGPALPATYYASSIEIQTLADAVSACINSAGGVAGNGNSCGSLFTDATPSGGSAPTDTVGAILDIVNNPTQNVCPIFMLVPSPPPFQPTLTNCPASWSLPITQLTVNVSGASSVYVGQTSQYTATVTGNSSQGVTWAVNGVTGGNSTNGTISSSGLYTPPSTAPSGAVTISATSVLSSTATGSTSVTVQPVTVAVSGPSSIVFSGTGQYSAVVTGAGQSVNWLVDGVAGGSAAEGTISSSGLYTAPSTTPVAPVTISAQSSAVSSASGSINVTIAATTVTYATGDSRTVTQPTYPSTCATLSAQFTTSQRSSPPAAASDDTTRIQAALDSTPCKNTGKSVELAVSGGNNAFYSELLTLNGEGLIIDTGATLYGGATYSNNSSNPELLLLKGTNSSLMGPGVVDGRGDIVANTNNTRLVQATNVNNLIVYNVTLQQSIFPNLYVQGANGFTAWGVTILTPATRPNADGIDIDSTTNATVINSTIEAGDDGVAVKTNSSAASNITVTNNRLYGTHGISIGSQTFLGVSNVLFSNNYLYGTDLVGNLSLDPQGINIKTDPTCGGTVQQVTYQNTCLYGVKHLIVLNAHYGACTGTSGIPQLQDIVIDGVYSTASGSGAYELFDGFSATYPINAYLANINLDVTAQNGNNQYAGIALDNSNVTPSGIGITTSTFSTAGSVPACSF